MTGWASEILPSLEALGLWSYWIVGGAAALEAFFLTGIVLPGTLIVDAGGALVRLGKLDFVELVWFVTLGALLGGEAGYWLGRRAGRGARDRWDPSGHAAFRRAERLVRRHGGVALVIGRFLGPVSGLASVSAALAGMPQRSFHLWNAVAALVYALVHVALGYAAGEALLRLGPLVERSVLLVTALLLILGLVWYVSARIGRGLPLLLHWLARVRDALLRQPLARRLVARHPRSAAFVARRFSTGHFGGLILTAFAAVLLYLGIAWADTVLDFLHVPQVAETDLRLARLIHAFWTPELLRFFGLVTQLGHWTVLLAVQAGIVAALVLTGRIASLVQIAVALGGELICVHLLKGAFARPRPELSYFVETTGSFPSGHATLAVAFWGTLVVILWRERLIGATLALVLAAAFGFLIGFSRLYLVEHFLSDVLNGWLLGGLWLVIGALVAEWLRHRGVGVAVRGGGRQALAVLALLLGFGGGGYLLVVADPPLAVIRAGQEPSTIDPAAFIASDEVPRRVETLTGQPLWPVPVYLVAKDAAALEAGLTAAGWTRAGTTQLGHVLHAAWADWLDRPDPGAPSLPLFWNAHPQMAAFRHADARTELRAWAAGPTAAGQSLFAVALSPLGPVRDWQLDAARDALIAGVGGPQQRVAGPAVDGEEPYGRDWSWDGVTVIGTLR